MVGAELFGVVNLNGRVAYLSPTVLVDAALVESTSRDGAAERAYRFSEPCAEHECAQWDADHCTLIDRVLESAADHVPVGLPLPACPIRRTCRWFSQRGTAACRVCPIVLTESRPASDGPDEERWGRRVGVADTMQTLHKGA